MRWARRPAPVWLLVTLAASFVMNLAWIPAMSDSVLLAGYWLWIGSIGTIAVAGLEKLRSAYSGVC